VFATTCRECPAGCGVHVRCREGRVVKAEGNPDHPINYGGLCPRGQSAPQGLYDPDRIRQPLRAGTASGAGAAPAPAAGTSRGDFASVSWSQALEDVTQVLRGARRLFLISDLQTGALAEILAQFHAALGRPGRVVFYEAFAYDALRAANGRLFGRPAIPRFRLQDCDLILSLGAEFLETWLSNVEFAWQFAQMHHRPPDYQGEMIYIGPRLSLTAANADYFLPVPAGREYDVAMAILRGVRERQGPPGEDGPAVRSSSPLEGVPRETIGRLADKLIQAKKAVVLGGPTAAAGPAA
jgi:molybdopterin-containing oxidoreductase family iron-sulfur binding subunit